MPETAEAKSITISSLKPIIVWLRQDLRLADHPALYAACETGRPIIFLYILSQPDQPWTPGAATRWWLHHSLNSLTKQLEPYQQRLILKSGPALTEIFQLCEQTGATTVYWNRRYDPADRDIDEEVKSCLKKLAIEAVSFPGAVLIEPWKIGTQNGDPYQVFTPFWKACLSRGEFAPPLRAPKKISAPQFWPNSENLEDWQLLPKIHWDSHFYDHWQPGEAGAHNRWNQFLENTASGYKISRDLPAEQGTSRLSPHLHFGEITPRQIFAAADAAMKKMAGPDRLGLDCYVREIGWRDFSYHVLFHFPHTSDHPLRQNFADFPWQNSQKWLTAWQKGLTGYPIVDAGMRELWQTGWMHNRVRMIVASFLTKDLFIHWKEGARWFWDTLVDADLPNNTMGWQWASGCGADAAPYFRIFNPILQSRKFDLPGIYLRRWCPELAQLPNKWIHAPWEAPVAVLKEAGVRLGENYPKPLVDHGEQRNLALQHWESIKSR